MQPPIQYTISEFLWKIPLKHVSIKHTHTSPAHGQTALVPNYTMSICQPSMRLAGSISLECELIGLTPPTGHYFIWKPKNGNSFQGWHHSWHPRLSGEDSSAPWSIVLVTEHRERTLKCHSFCLTAFQINQPLVPAGLVWSARTGEEWRVIPCLSYHVHVCQRQPWCTPGLQPCTEHALKWNI